MIILLYNLEAMAGLILFNQSFLTDADFLIFDLAYNDTYQKISSRY